MTPYEPELFQLLEGFLSRDRREKLRAVLALRTRQLSIVLDGVYHPHNTSAVLRSCDAFGIQNVDVVENSHQQQLSRKVAGGSDKWLTMRRYSGRNATRDCIARLAAEGRRIVVTCAEADAITPERLDLARPMAIILGNEAAGVSPEFREAATDRLTIPMVGFVESLNLSVAAALCLQALTTRLRAGDLPWRLRPDEAEELLYEWTRKAVPHAANVERRWRYECRHALSGTGWRPVASS
jgi:tRNA (guanosine-2'-O-)-methyltransferase